VTTVSFWIFMAEEGWTVGSGIFGQFEGLPL
jgi:hypothetical protein